MAIIDRSMSVNDTMLLVNHSRTNQSAYVYGIPVNSEGITIIDKILLLCIIFIMVIRVIHKYTNKPLKMSDEVSMRQMNILVFI